MWCRWLAARGGSEMAFLYDFTKKKFLFGQMQPPPWDPLSGLPKPPEIGLVKEQNCCCCPCCQITEGAQVYTCTNDVRKAFCQANGGTPNCNHATCQPDTCCNGACCQGESCSITADVVCQELGGTFKGCGTTCAEVVCDEPCSGPCDSGYPCPAGCVCCDGVCCDGVCCDGVCVSGECVTQCPSECGAEGDCGPQCECCTTWVGGSPGFLVSGCSFVSEGYACCCDFYKKLCYVDKSETRAGTFPPPNIVGSPPDGAILLSRSGALSIELNLEIEGTYWGEEENRYTYGYWFVCDDGEDEHAPGDGPTDWFDLTKYSPGFWQTFCDAATANSVGACAENPAP